MYMKEFLPDKSEISAQKQLDKISSLIMSSSEGFSEEIIEKIAFERAQIFQKLDPDMKNKIYNQLIKIGYNKDQITQILSDDRSISNILFDMQKGVKPPIIKKSEINLPILPEKSILMTGKPILKIPPIIEEKEKEEEKEEEKEKEIPQEDILKSFRDKSEIIEKSELSEEISKLEKEKEEEKEILYKKDIIYIWSRNERKKYISANIKNQRYEWLYKIFESGHYVLLGIKSLRDKLKMILNRIYQIKSPRSINRIVDDMGQKDMTDYLQKIVIPKLVNMSDEIELIDDKKLLQKKDIPRIKITNKMIELVIGQKLYAGVITKNINILNKERKKDIAEKRSKKMEDFKANLYIDTINKFTKRKMYQNRETIGRMLYYLVKNGKKSLDSAEKYLKERDYFKVNKLPYFKTFYIVKVV